MGVIGIHFGGSFVRSDNVWTDSFYLGLALNQFFSFAVPAFIFLSGWLLQMSYGTFAIDIKTFYRRRLVKLGIPYLLVTLTYFIFFRKTWIIQQLTMENFLPRFLYYGIEPTLYFVPLIFQLYLLFPFLKKMDDCLIAKNIKQSAFKNTKCILSLFFIMHLIVGHLAYTGKINYHWLCLRFFPFWLFYFYAGMQFTRLFSTRLSKQMIVQTAAVAISIAFGFFAWDIYVVTDVRVVGISYEKNILDFAYSRPEIVLFNFCIVFSIGVLLLMKWRLRMPFLEFVGKYSYHVYVWHIPLLLGIAWKNPNVIILCAEYPELILCIVLFAAATISFAISITDQSYLIRYRYIIVQFLSRLRMIVERC